MIICPLCKKPSLIFDTGGITGKYICKNCSYKGTLSIEIPNDFLKFRYFFTSKGNIMLLGKNAESNELLLKKFTKANELVFHTKAVGSPFCVIKADYKAISEIEKKEAARMCSVFSKEWKNGKKIIEVHSFLGKNIFKEKNMAKGTFGVKKIEKKYRIKAEAYLCLINDTIEVLPYKSKVIGIIESDKKGLNKQDAINKIREYAKKKDLKISLYIERELPARAIKIVWQNG